MKDIKRFILEASNIGKPSDYKTQVEDVINAGKEKNLKIVFRDRTTNSGDFAFFIYDKKKQDRYLIGYDGDWNAKDDENTSFKSCIEATYEYIENYKQYQIIKVLTNITL